MDKLSIKINWHEPYLISGRIKILENVRILVYKENPILFELLEYQNDKIFNEPLLFAFFYAKKRGVTLEQLLWGYIEKSKCPKSINALTDKQGIIYLPEIGWLKTALIEAQVVLTTTGDGGLSDLCVTHNEEVVPFTFEPIQKIENTSFELVNHQHQLLQPHFIDAKNRLVNVDIDNISQLQRGALTKAFELIRSFAPEYYKLLEQSVRKVVIFNDPQVKRNSFATLSVHGCAFFNSFQKEYDEVFFIEDIAHQCGHVIFNNITHINKDIFRVSSETVIKERGFFGMIINLLEERTLFVAFHALFTYYAISICLEACILKSDLTELQKHEALGRLAFCFHKYGTDINLLKKVDKEGKSTYFTEAGLELYQPMEIQYKRLEREWAERLKKMHLLNQPYNFSVKNFHKSNPLK